MITFDSFTLVPAYSTISSRSEIDISSEINIKNNRKRNLPQTIKTDFPIINANMHSVCTQGLCTKLLDQYNTFTSFHRFEEKDRLINIFKNLNQYKNFDKFFASIGVQKTDYEFVKTLYDLGVKNIIIDVNHGHHKMVGDMIYYIKKNFPDLVIMAGNVSSTSGIKYLRDYGTDIVKIGNSFGYSCTTIKATGYGVHPIHVAKTFREDTNDWDTMLCVDGGVREVADIAKSLIWGNLVMLGKMFAGCLESNGKFEEDQNGNKFKTYWGNASAATKSKTQDHVKYVEGAITKVPYVGSVSNVMNSINDGLQSAFSFVGARNLNEYQIAANKSILMI